MKDNSNWGVEQCYCSNSCITLSDGRTIYCENEVETIEKELKDSSTNIILLMPSDLEGKTISVYKNEIKNYTYTD